MGTRALYLFEDENEKFVVYSHWDNYPAGAREKLLRAKKFAWKFPRFEASDFGAAFIAANKSEGGGSYFLTLDTNLSGDYWQDFNYHVTREGVRVLNADATEELYNITWEQLDDPNVFDEED